MLGFIGQNYHSYIVSLVLAFLLFRHLSKSFLDTKVQKIQANSSNQLADECSNNEVSGLLRVSTYGVGSLPPLSAPRKLLKHLLFRFHVKYPL